MNYSYPKIGVHISAAGDVTQAPIRAKEIGCECFQFFSRPPQGGPAKIITTEIAKNFKANSVQFSLESYVHAPYFINFGSSNKRIYHGSITIIREELERSSLLGVKYLMTHLGSGKDLGREKAINQTIDGLAEMLEGYKGETGFLIELAAGAGEILGASFEEIERIISNKKLKKYQIGVCFDTAHAFASGYDLKDNKAVKKTFDEFDKTIGLDNLKLMHVNDSMVELGAKKDRHEHIGQGKIGLDGFKAIVKLMKKLKVNLILETPHDEKLVKDIEALKKMK